MKMLLMGCLLSWCLLVKGTEEKQLPGSPATNTWQGLSLKLKADRTSFAIREDVVVKLMLINNHHHEWNLAQFYNNIDGIGERSAFRFHVIREGESAERKYIHLEMLKEMYVPFEQRRIAPGLAEIITLKVTLNRWYDMSRPGKYSIVCIYSLKGPFPMNESMPMWEGTIQSNPVVIELK